MEKINNQQIDDLIKSELFGILPNGAEINKYTIQNKNGFELSLINYGATITSLKIPSENNLKTDIVLGFDSLDQYINSFHLPSPPYLGSTIGRYSGRINNGQFILNSEKYQLNKNHGNNHLHGGNYGFNTKNWKLVESSKNDKSSLTFQYISKDGEENYPGEVKVEVTYILTDDNELKIHFFAKSNQDTILNLTNHSYFNLDGHDQNIGNQKLLIHSNKTLEINDEQIPTGKYIEVLGSETNFLTEKNCPESIDTTFVLNNTACATLYSAQNKIKMTVTTNQPSVHVYVGGNCFNEIYGKEKSNYHTQSGICFETQNFPDAPNHPNFPNSILKKDSLYINQTTFKFEKK
ncbi:MAG: galactose mutarotase [Flavobacterium sp.]|nr:galactose mutarotase [Flavobacterium sp.]